MKRILILPGLLLALSAAAPAQAAEAPEPSTAQTIQMETVALPVIVDGKLLNYVFVSIKLELVSKADGAAVRAKEQFFRDDLVRTGHRTPFTRFDDYTKVDEAKVRAEILRAAPGIVGPGVVKTAAITKQVPQKMLGVPRTAAKTTRDIIP
jgi:flagellar basal body-associated protein FliL